jgi:hypothetical protein
MPNRLRILAKIVKGLAEAEVHVDARRQVEFWRFDESTHAIDQRRSASVMRFTAVSCWKARSPTRPARFLWPAAPDCDKICR